MHILRFFVFLLNVLLSAHLQRWNKLLYAMFTFTTIQSKKPVKKIVLPSDGVSMGYYLCEVQLCIVNEFQRMHNAYIFQFRAQHHWCT